MARTPRLLYLESSFWNRLVGPASDPRRRDSFHLLRLARRHHQISVSPLVIGELDATPDPIARRRLRRWIASEKPRRLSLVRETHNLASSLLAAGVWGQRKRHDMTHLACAILSGAWAVVSWDTGDLACPETRTVLMHLARKCKFHAPLIGTPPEVVSWLTKSTS